MNLFNQRLIPMAAALVTGLVLNLSPVHTVMAQDHESQCAEAIQGKISWDDGSHTNWDPENVKQLCAGTKKPEEPGKCFSAINTEHASGKISWGKGNEWDWRNIINLCAGTNDAEKTITCFKNGIKTGADWRDTILICHRSSNS